jgi:hypothetical protein
MPFCNILTVQFAVVAVVEAGSGRLGLAAFSVVVQALKLAMHAKPAASTRCLAVFIIVDPLGVFCCAYRMQAADGAAQLRFACPLGQLYS